MAKARALDKRRKSIKNIRKITRTMELVSTAQFRPAMLRANAADSYAKRIVQLVSDLAQTGLKTEHPLLAKRETKKRAVLFDKNGDNHYDTISAFIKSMRGSDPDAALYWCAKKVHLFAKI